MFLQAADTHGTVKKNNTVNMIVHRVDGAKNTIMSEPITVVSAPAADLYIDNGGNPYNQYPQERYFDFVNNQSLNPSGTFNIKTYKLSYAGWSSLGATDDGNWATPEHPLIINVSEFPSITEWTFDGKKVNAVGGKLTINDADYNGSSHTLGWSIPLADKYDYKCEELGVGKLMTCSFTFKDDFIKNNPDDYNKLKDLADETKQVTDDNGKVTNQVISHNGAVVSLPIQIIPDNKVFSTDDNDEEILNLGKGSEPGANNDRNASTQDASIGARAGYPYLNNDWTRAPLRRIDPYGGCTDQTQEGQPCFYISKTLDRPYTSGKTIFENANKNFGSENGSNGNSTSLSPSYGSNSHNVAQNTYVRVNLTMGAESDYDCTDINGDNDGDKKAVCNFTISDDWLTEQQQYRGELQVKAPDGRILNDNEYTVQWTKDNTPSNSNDKWEEVTNPKYELSNYSMDKNTGMTWINGIPSENDWNTVSAIRIRLSNDLPIKANQSYSITFLMQEIIPANGCTADNSGNATDCGNRINIYDDAVGTIVDSVSTPHVTQWYKVVDMPKPTASIDNNLKLINPSIGNAIVCDYNECNGNKAIANPGYIAYYKSTPRYGNIAFSDANMTPTVKVTLNIGALNDIVNDSSSNWDMTVSKQDKNGNALELTFTYKGGSLTPSVDINGNGSLPEISYHGTVSNRSAGTITDTVDFAYNVSKTDIDPVYKHDNVTNNEQPSVSFIIPSDRLSGGMITANGDKEVNEPLSWHANIYTRGTEYSDSKQSETVLKLPDNNDDGMLGAKGCTNLSGSDANNNNVNNDDNPGIDCTWHEYDRGSSHYAGKISLTAEPTVKTDNSTTTTFMYAVGNANIKNSDDPDDYTWKTWAALTAAEKTDIHAIKVVSQFEDMTVQDDTGADKKMKVAASDITISIQPTGSRNIYQNYNHSGDSYVLWIGRNYVSNKPLAGHYGNSQNWMPLADVNKVYAGYLSGTTWWDASNDAYMNKTEKRIPDVQVILCKAEDVTADKKHCGDNNDGKAMKTMNTWTAEDMDNTGADDKTGTGSWKNDYMADDTDANKNLTAVFGKDFKPWIGGYQFIELHSGNYVTIVKRVNGAGTTDGSNVSNNAVPTLIDKSEDYYNVERKVANTYSYKNNVKEGSCKSTVKPDSQCADADRINNAKDYSDAITIPAGGSVKNVDYGYYAPHPKVAVNKTIASKTCDSQKCTIQWVVNLKNAGDTIIRKDDNAVLTDSMSSDVKLTSETINQMKPGAAQVSTQGEHSLALISGKVYAWGYNAYGQLGNGNTDSTGNKTITEITNLDNCTAVAAGSMHSAAICNGKLYTWGLNDLGQLGNGSYDTTPDAHSIPASVSIPNNEVPVLVAAGSSNTYVITSAGNLYETTSSGRWANRVSGVSTVAGSLSAYGTSYGYIKNETAYKVKYGSASALSATNVVQISVGYDGWIAIKNDGSVVTDNNAKVTSPASTDNPAVSVSAGYKSYFIVYKDGTVKAASNNSWGQLGLGTEGSGTVYTNGNENDGRKSTPNDKIATLTPSQLKATTNQTGDSTDGKLQANNANIIAAGYQHSVIVSDDGNIKITGQDAYGLNGRKITDTTDVAGLDVYKGAQNTSAASAANPDLKAGNIVDTENYMPIEHTSESAETAVNGDTENGKVITRTYALPYDLPAGQEINFVFTGDVTRNQAVKQSDGTYKKGADIKVVNQSWFTAGDVPFERTPNARVNNTILVNAKTPVLPKKSDYGSHGDDVTSGGYTDADKDGSKTTSSTNYTCKTGSDWGGENNEHVFMTANTNGYVNTEDSCDQVGAVITGVDKGAIFGSVSGIYWEDANKNGIRTDDELNRFGNATVSLWQLDDAGNFADKIAEVKTCNYDKCNADGSEYKGNANTPTSAGGSMYDNYIPKGGYLFTHIPIDKNCTYQNDPNQPNEGSVIGCDSLSYKVLFSGVNNYEFTKQDANEASANDIASDGSVNDSDVDTENADADNQNVSTATVKWAGVNTDQNAETSGFKHVDAGLFKTVQSFTDFPMTGSHWILIVLMLVSIATFTIIRLNRIDSEYGM